MFNLKKIARWVAAPLAAYMFATTFAIGTAQAGLVSTDDVAGQRALAADRAQVMEFLSRDDVRQGMVDLGVDPAEAEARVSAMSDSEIIQLATRIDQDPAGEGAVGAIVGAALLVFLVLLITDIAGVTDAFDFDN